jgi:hypothetical protein
MCVCVCVCVCVLRVCVCGWVGVSTTEIQAIGPISMNFGTFEYYELEMVFM